MIKIKIVKPTKNRQSKKRLDQSKRKAAFNKSQKSALKTMIKSVVKTKDENSFSKLQQKLDRLGSKNIIHKNKADRIKSRIFKKIKAQSAV